MRVKYEYSQYLWDQGAFPQDRGNAQIWGISAHETLGPGGGRRWLVFGRTYKWYSMMTRYPDVL